MHILKLLSHALNMGILIYRQIYRIGQTAQDNMANIVHVVKFLLFYQ